MKRKYASRRLLKELPTQEQMAKVLFGLFNSPDHAVAVTGPAYLDHALELLLDAKFRPLSPTDWERMFDAAQGAILGPASAKIRLAYALQLIDDGTYHDLQLINEVRNVFAHTLHPCDFTNAEVTEDCAKLKTNTYAEQFPVLMGIDAATTKGKFTCAILLRYTTLTQRLKPLIKAKLLLEKEPWRTLLDPSPEQSTHSPLNTDIQETDGKES